jgi:hypothetical protein
MNNITQNTLEQINTKLEWAIRSIKKIENSNKDKIEIQDNFWSFLTAYQQIWFYFNRWIEIQFPLLKPNERKEFAKNMIETWKTTKLDDAERNAWDTLQKLRNHDTHREPIYPEVIEKTIVFHNGQGIVFRNSEGKIFCTKDIKHVVQLDEIEYNVFSLSHYGIIAVKKLIEFIHEIK